MITLFSSLKNSKTLGASLVVAGTMIGSGMLAMPLTSVSIGFSNSLYALLGIATLMLLSSFVQADLLRFEKSGISFATLVSNNLGEKYRILPSIIKCLLFYSLLASYITGASTILSGIFINYFSLSVPFYLVVICFSTVFGILISIPTHSMDLINRFFVIIMFIIFFIIIHALKPDFSLLSSSPENIVQGNFFHVILVFFTAFGFHGSIPTLVDYLEKKIKKIYASFTIGMLLTIFVYFVWQYSIISIFDSNNIQLERDASLVLFFEKISSLSQNEGMLRKFLDAFYLLVIVTSFIGVGIGQFNYLHEVVDNSSKLKMNKRILPGILTVLPPIFFALLYPTCFITALKFAGLWLCMLALILPGIMGLKSKKNSTLMKLLSIISLLFGIFLISIEYLIYL